MVPAAVNIQDEVGIPSNQMPVSVKASRMSSLQLNEAVFSGIEHAPKVRKPYTITKQRERWTEEEHKKFIEALQLYGRAWRKIEDHIGTKTAVQIRSHAQKFFSKLTRDSASNSTGDVKPIEIPPPRPKRKPLHPYPRKFANMSTSGNPVLKQLERTSLQISSDYGVENRSPTSVLSAAGSDTLGSTFSNHPNTCLSPVSSAAGSNEQDNGGQSPARSVKGENRSPSPGPTIAGPTDDNRPSMKLNQMSDDNASSGEGSSVEAQAHAFKLFGKTVVIDSQKPSSTSSVGNIVRHLNLSPTTGLEGQHLKLSPNAHMDMAAQAEQLTQGPPHEVIPGAPGRSAWTPWHGALPPWSYCIPLPRDNSSEPTSVPPPPWWAFYGNLPFPFIHPQEPAVSELPPKTCNVSSGEKEMQMEVSWTGSSTSSASDSGVGNQNADFAEAGRPESSVEIDSAPASGLKLSDTSAFSSWKASSNKSSPRGFVPYKRCAAESEEQHLQTPNEDAEGQAIQLCL